MDYTRAINTTLARDAFDWLAADPKMLPWAGESETHYTQIRQGMSFIVAKNEAGRLTSWVESCPAKSRETEQLASFARFAPAGVAVLGRLEASGRWQGLAVLGTTQHGPEKWAAATVDEHNAAMVQWGVPLSNTLRIPTGTPPAEVEAKMLALALADSATDGFWIRSSGLGTWRTWGPQYEINLITMPRAGLKTSDGYLVDMSAHGFAGGHTVRTTYRGVRKGRMVDRGDITATSEAADDLHVDDRFVSYWYSAEGKKEHETKR